MVGFYAVILAVSAFVQNGKVELTKQNNDRQQPGARVFKRPVANPRSEPFHNFGKVSNASGGQGHVSNIIVSSSPVRWNP